MGLMLLCVCVSDFCVPSFKVQHVKTLRSRFLRRRHPLREQQEDQDEEDITSQPEGTKAKLSHTLCTKLSMSLHSCS